MPLSNNYIVKLKMTLSEGVRKSTPKPHLLSVEMLAYLAVYHKEAYRSFSVDGVLLRSSSPLPRAAQALTHLQRSAIPFVLLTNGGGKTEAERVSELSRLLSVSIPLENFVQSHTPFASLIGQVNRADPTQTPLKDRNILVIGGEGDKCRKVAESYGYKHVITPSDIVTAKPDLWPYAFASIHTPHARPLPLPIYAPNNDPSSPPPSLLDPTSSARYLRISAAFVYHDPRDWALDTQILLDLLLSHAGFLGTTSSCNNNPDLPNRGYQQDYQPRLYYSNPDLQWATSYHLPRLGQGGFKHAFQNVWHNVTGGAKLYHDVFGKPHQKTFQVAEQRLGGGWPGSVSDSDGDGDSDLHEESRTENEGKDLSGSVKGRLKRVYMIGDNPESDIRGSNMYQSPKGVEWHSILVRSGVYSGGKPKYEPKIVVDDVWDGVRWALKREGKEVVE
ncbi:MAG: hypothetical protein Q9167_003861 [Letrouitia subvulpina]